MQGSRLGVMHLCDRYVWGHVRRQDKAQQAEVAEQLQAELDWLESCADQAGPFFMGAEFSLVVRIPLAPFVRIKCVILVSFKSATGLRGDTGDRIWRVCAGLCSDPLVCARLHP